MSPDKHLFDAGYQTAIDVLLTAPAHETAVAVYLLEAHRDGRPPAYATTPKGHTYTSTACHHGLHTRCGALQAERGEPGAPHCKFCPTPCVCGCHDGVATEVAEGRREETPMAGRTVESTLERIVTARKAHRCDGYRCASGCITPGQRYLITSLPPRTDANSSDHWWTMRICSVCHPLPTGDTDA